ncbi:MAG: proprotein convertase P-domain-containing protein, partial [Verrucomicrobiae bacterium]|nr:proprotein convertase P-domain-containing protein [Verrucomicrobiae bacterium]
TQPYRHVFFEYDDHCRLTAVHEPVIANERQYGEFFSNMAIPDNDEDGLVHEILVDSEEEVGIVTLSFASITHPRHQDLQVILESPTGTQVTLFDQEVGSGELDLRNTRLFEFMGENPSGLWKVIVKDLQSGEFGNLTRWEIALSGPSNPVYFSYPDVDFTAAGQSQILGSTDMLGERIFSNEYDNQRRVIRQDDGVDTNQKSAFTYDFNNPSRRVTTYTDRVGESWETVHDEALRLVSSKTPIGAETTWKYTEHGQTESVTNPLGQVVSFTWDENGFLASSTDAIGDTTLFDHDIYGNLLYVEDSMGHETQFQYNTSERTIRRIIDAQDGRTDKRYGPNQEIIENLIEDGGGVSYGWSSGQLRSAGHIQENSSAELTNDPAGRPLIITDGDGFETKIKYRPNGDIIEKENPQGGIRKTVYDYRSRILESIDRKGRSTYYEYDGNDNLVKITDTTGEESFFEYDGEDRVIREIDSEGRQVTYTFDAAGRQTSITNPQDQTTTLEYDLIGNQTKITDYKDLVLQKVVYDKRNQPVSITDPYGNTSTVEYDALGRQSSVTDAAGRTSYYEYDELDRLTQITDPLGRVYKQEYHADDLVRRFTEPMGEQTNFGYDQANRPISVSNQYYSSGPSNYNARDLITRLQLPGQDRFTLNYDDNGRVQTINEFRNTNFNEVVRARFYSYDANDNVTQISEKIGPGGGFDVVATRTYDTKNRVTSYTNDSAETLGYAYNDEGSLDRVTYPDGKTVEYFYDELNRLERVLDWADRETIYAYNDQGRVARITFPNGTTREMSYDDAGRVTERTDYDVNSNVIVQYGYSYNDASDILVETLGHDIPPYQPPNVTMTYRAGNLLDTYNGMPVNIDTRGNTTSAPLNGVTVNFEYDIRGNMTKAGDIDYFYDAEDRLAGWNVAGETTRFTTNPVAGLSQILVKTAPGNQLTRYVYGIGLIYEDTPDGLRVFHYDERGNTVALSNAAGEVSGTVAYGPYGEVHNRTGETDTLFLQNGLFGVVTGPQGLCYMRYRWYSSEFKRFLRQDAHFGDITVAGSLNRFAYAGGNPISRIDPNGEAWILAGALIGAVVSVGVELVVDLADGNGLDHSFGDYAAAAIGGAITGAIVAWNPAYAITGEVTGAAATNLLAAAFNGEPVEPTSLASDILIAAAFGKLGGGRGGSRLVKKAGGDDAAKAASKLTRGREFGTFFTPEFSSKYVYRNLPTLNYTPRSTTFRNYAEEGAKNLKDFGIDVLAGSVQTAISLGLTAYIDFVIENPEVFAHEEIIMDPRYQSVESRSTVGNFGKLYSARTATLQGRRGRYGEFNHWKLYTGSLLMARETVPVENAQQLNTF